MVFRGSCHRNVFESWVENVLIKELQVGQCVVMDHASFHKSQRTIGVIESVGCRVIFLPPYSPDLNPIEKFWSNMKRWIKNQMTQFDTWYDILVQFFKPQTST